MTPKRAESNVFHFRAQRERGAPTFGNPSMSPDPDGAEREKRLIKADFNLEQDIRSRPKLTE